MRILIADKLPEACCKALADLGLDVGFSPSLGADDLPQAIGDAAILVVRSTKVSAAAIGAGSSLSLIVRAGAGVNTIDLAAASARGVYVANCPGKNAVAVAELVMGLLLATDRRIPDNVADLRAGRWNKREYGKAGGLRGRTLGVVGVGNIGREVVHRALAFGLRCICWSPSLTDASAAALGASRAEGPLAVASASDFVTIHTAYSKATHHLVDADFLAAMRPGALLIHTARGGVVDDAALAEAVRSGHVRAALDVYEEEPAAGDSEYKGAIGALDGVYGTHHIGASTLEAQEAVADEVLRIVRSYVTSGEVPNVVNLATHTPATWQLTVRHLDQVGVLAAVLDRLMEEGINVQEVHNTIFADAVAASASLQLDQRPSEALMGHLAADEKRIIHVELLELARGS
jgi:D-3-phosphoglycerate dehydrogenase